MEMSLDSAEDTEFTCTIEADDSNNLQEGQKNAFLLVYGEYYVFI